MHILSGRSYATLNNDKSILWYDREISLKWGQTKTSTKKKKKQPYFWPDKAVWTTSFYVFDRYCRNDCIKLTLGASPNKQNITKTLDSCIGK